METGFIQIYYGEGQGKSSAAFGNAVRVAGSGKKAYIVQFLKGHLDDEFLKRFEPEVKCFSFEKYDKPFNELTEEEKEEQKANILNGIQFAKKSLTTGECDVLVLDEIFGIIDEGIITEDEVISILNTKSLFASVILTGINATDRIKDMADSVIKLDLEK